ncbi:MAG: 50S ribosomal protein L9 [Syntrophales bacterium]|nr:50S ribosomal protein L9 [Syntrophales bacterium]
MKVILKEDVEALGRAGQVVTVSKGYGRNYLIPKNLALEANTKNVKVLEREKALIADRMEKEKKVAEAISLRLGEVSVTIGRKIGEQGKLFGSVTSRDIEEALAAQGVEINRKSIILEEPLREAGEFQVRVKLYKDIFGHVTVNIVGES